MNQVPRLMSGWLVKHKAIKPSDRELYEYAIYSFLISITPLVIFLIASGVMGLWLEGVMIIFPFMVIRKFSGGYHAKYAYVCMVVSTALLCICLFVAIHADSNWALHTLMGTAGISIMVNSPIDSENKRLTEVERKHYRYVTSLLVITMIMFYIILIVFRIERYSICIAVSLILVALLQLPQILKNRPKMKEKCRFIQKVLHFYK